VSTYVLIHGSWHGAWCWERVIPRLEAAGHRVVAPDLPGHGDNPAPLSAITLESLVAAVVEALEAEPDPAILVGHSFGGVMISRAAELRPEKVSLLVYVAAFLPRNGQSLFEIIRSNDSDRSGNLVYPNLVIDEAAGSVTVRDEVLREAFFHDCPDEDARWAIARLVPEALAPRRAPVSLSAERFGRLPRVYIETLQDRANPASLQRAMVAATPCEQVVSMDTGHSPFYAAPDELADHLLAPARGR
jgi:pimeloyl-ACP methyl ester carboxylesterase